MIKVPSKIYNLEYHEECFTKIYSLKDIYIYYSENLSLKIESDFFPSPSVIMILFIYLHGILEIRTVWFDAVLWRLNGFSASFEIMYLRIFSATSWCLSISQKCFISLFVRPSVFLNSLVSGIWHWVYWIKIKITPVHVQFFSWNDLTGWYKSATWIWYFSCWNNVTLRF